jgi:hypothetical protein
MGQGETIAAETLIHSSRDRYLPGLLAAPGVLGARRRLLEDEPMRTIKWLVSLAVAGTAAGWIVSGCGGDDNVAGSQDSGSDHTTDHAAEAAGGEAGMDSGMEAAACVPDADLTTLMLPDASLGDSGATVPSCFACIETTCTTEVAACNVDCACNSAVSDFVTCVAGGMSPINCGMTLAAVDMQSSNLAFCVAGTPFGPGPGCLASCGAGGLFNDGGPDGATEGGGDDGGGEGSAGEAGASEGGSEAGGDAASD